MAEGVSMSPEDAASARAAEQARLRKDRREAKIKAGGASRLNKISGLVGGLPQDVEPITIASASPSSPPVPRPIKQKQPSAHADPEEVDISQHFYQTRATPRVPTPRGGEPDIGNITEDDLRQMMLGFDDNSGGGAGGPAADDPFLQMMMQGMGGGGAAGGAPGGGFPFPFPPGGGGGAGNPLANMMFSDGMPGAPPAQQAALPDRYASLWRLLHTAVALGLGLYIALWTSFSGTKLDRDLSSARASGGKGEGMEPVVMEGDRANAEMARRFFWAFATAEAVLLTTRFFMDRGRVAEQGMLGMLVGFLPGGIGRYVKVGLQYGQIFSTVKADVLVCVFVLGACSWLRS